MKSKQSQIDSGSHAVASAAAFEALSTTRIRMAELSKTLIKTVGFFCLYLSISVPLNAVAAVFFGCIPVNQ